MRPKASAHPLRTKPRRYLTSAALVVVSVGLAGALLSAINAMQRSQSLMLSRAITAAGALPADEIRSLEGNDKDLANPTYQNLKRRLTRIRQENPGMRFIYLFGQNSRGEAFFYVDSEPVNSPDYSPPGELYPEASSRVHAAFVEDTSFIEGPLGDSYGTWISAMAPVVDESTGQVVAVLGIDVNAYDYYFQIGLYAVIPLLLAAIPLTVLLRNRRLEAKEREVMELKTQFVSVASHELRSPLTGALWGVQSLLRSDGNLTDKQKSILTSVYNSTATSLASVNEVLDFSVFDRGKADKLQRVEVDLVAVLHDVQKVLDLSAQEAGVHLRFVGDWPDTAATIGDPAALKRAFSNIVSNAVKYSSKDTAVEFAYQRKDKHHIVSIQDHGIGIPKNEQAKVLTGYYRATNASKRLVHGTGMGLWITRLIIEQHHGALYLDSKVNKGTTVHVSLPAGQEQSAPDQQ